MANKYGGLIFPVPAVITPGSFPPEQVLGDPLLGYVANFLAKIMTHYAGDAWTAVSPSTPIVKAVSCDEPEAVFNEALLPCLYVFRPGRETREMVETFEQVADEYRFQKSRLVARWILNPVSQANQRRRNQLVDTVRKVIDQAVQIGRDKNWIVPNDPDVKAVTFGSSLCNFSGAAVIELDHAAPGTYQHKMMLPAPIKNYDELKMSFLVEELLDRDLTLVGEPNNEGETKYVSPDQGTGLGEFVLGTGIYE